MTQHTRPRTLTHALLIRHYHTIAARPHEGRVVTWSAADRVALVPARVKALTRICQLRSQI